MNGIILVAFVTATFADFATSFHGVPQLVKYIPEAFSAVVALCVLLEGMRTGFSLVAPKYLIVFGLLVFVIVCGVLTNGVGSGPVLSGTRFYLRGIPLFFLPAIARFSDKQIQQQLKLLLFICLVQLPLAVYQRWTIFSAGRFSGDDVRGTVGDSGVLSIVLISAVLIVTGFFMHKRITRGRFLLLCALLLLPTTINETKATVILLPIGLLATLMLTAPSGKRLKLLAGTLIALVAFGSILVPIYDYMNKDSPFKKERNIMDFFTNEKQMVDYMQAKKGVAAVGTTKQVRRGDAIEIPFAYISRDPVHFAFGLGLGNVSPSTLGQNFVGEYNGLFRSFLLTSFTIFLLEIGVLGTALIFVLYWLLGADALALAKAKQGLVSSLAAGWFGIVIVMFVSLFYTLIHTYSALTYLFWYFSGVVAAHRSQMVMAATRAVVARRRQTV